MDFKDTITWYDDNAKEYAKNLYTVTPIESIEKFLNFLPDKPFILEAGCGPGRESKVFIEKGIRVVGVDLSEGLLKIARENNPTAEYIKANFLNLPFEDKAFDGVWSHASLVHLETMEDVRKALAEFRRVLKPVGVVYVCVKAQAGTEKTAVVSDSLSKHERFFRYYTRDELVGLLADAGFEMAEIGYKADMHGRAEVRWIECIARSVR